MANTTALGLEAEGLVSKKLQESGFTILERNWKTPACEIDIIASKDGVVYMVEVKFRSNTKTSQGFDHVTSKKIKQMAFAANVWANQERYDGDYRLMAAEVNQDHKIKIVEIE